MTKVESKRPDITNLATKAALNIKATENKNKIPKGSKKPCKLKSSMQCSWYSRQN